MTSLWPHQLAAADAVDEKLETHRSTLVVAATGTGKTTTGGEIVRRWQRYGRALWIAHREELVRQAAKRMAGMGLRVGVEMAGERVDDLRDLDVVVGTVQSLSTRKRLAKFSPDDFALLVTDECFPAGTLVDGKPIEKIEVGEVVSSFDETTGQLVQRRVVRRFVSAPKSMVNVISSGKSIVCTASHPFYARKPGENPAWLPADALTGGDMVLCTIHGQQPNDVRSMWEAEREGSSAHLAASLLRPVQGDQEDRTGAGGDATVRGVRHACRASWEARQGVEATRTSVLRGGAQEAVGEPALVRANGGHEQEIRLGSYESAQSDAFGGSPSASEDDAACDGVEAVCPGRQRKAAARAADAFGVGAGVADGGGDPDGQEARFRISDGLQGGHRGVGAEGCDRSRWDVAQIERSQGAGPEEGSVLAWTRVDRVEVLESGSDGTFGGVCPDGLVYNLEVEGTHTYVADGFVVHNCHHAVAATWRRVIDHFPQAKVVGLTATPDRGDGVAMGRLFESTAHVYGIRDGIRDGFLCRVKQKAIEIEGFDLREVRTTAGDLNEGDLERLLLDPDLLQRIAGAIVEAAGDRKTMVFCVTVAHAHALAATLNGFEPESSRALDGGSDGELRRQTLQDFADDKFKRLCNCLDEQTQILTRRGWLGIDEIRDDDETAVMVRETGVMLWQSISRVVRRERASSERMVAISNQTIDVRVTEGHAMLVRAPGAVGWKRLDAETLPDRVGPYQLPLAATGTPERLTAPDGITPPWNLTADDCRFIGLFISDGSIDRNGWRGVQISQSETYQSANAEIRRILDACGFDWKMRRVAHVALKPGYHFDYRIPKGNIGGELRRRGWARLDVYLDKSFSSLLFGLDRNQTLALIEGIWLGDGIKEKRRPPKRGRQSWRIVNTDKGMLDRLQALAVTRGFACNICGPRDNGPMATKPIYTIAIRDRAAVVTNNHSIATSGGNPARFEDGWQPERVWCVTNQAGTIITRRNGKVAVMGQCQLFTEGFDEPSIACVAVTRPTKSRAFYTQMVGRGLRTFKGKPDCVILDFQGNAGKHTLACPIDILGGADVDPAVKKKAAAAMAERPDLDLLTALEMAARELAAERRAKALSLAQFRAVDVDPFELADAVLGGAEEASESDGGGGVLADNLRYLAEHAGGLRADAMKPSQVAAVAGALKARKEAGRATWAQMRCLQRAGLDPDVDFETAAEAIRTLAATGWQATPALRARIDAARVRSAK